MEEIKQLANQERNLINTAVNNITVNSKEIITQLDDFKVQCLDEINFQEKAIVKETEVVKEQDNSTTSYTLDTMDETLNQSVTTINTLVQGVYCVLMFYF